MNPTITVSLKRVDKDRLSRLAVRYGLSLPDFAKKVLTELQDSFPLESFEEYKNPKALKASLHRALKDLRMGHIQTRL